MRRKSLALNKEQEKKRQRIIFRLLIITAIMVTIGGISIAWSIFVSDLYTAFILNSIGTSFLYTTALTLCSIFLYLFFIITIFNPQGIKKSSIIKFTFGGVFTLIISIFLLTFSVTETIKSIQDMKDYSNGEWQVKDLLVMDVYRGASPSRIVLIETSEGEMTLHWESFRIYEGQKYRLTYLDATNTIIKIEKITH